MDKGTKARAPNHKKKFRSPVCGKRPHKTSVFPKFRLNLKEPEKHVHKAKHKSSKTGSKLQFRLGGDSTDPLNLNSLINRDPSEVTPQCSPYVDRARETSPQVFMQPQDVTDPLNLKCDLYQDLKGIVVVTPTRKKRRRKHNESGNCHDEDRENEPEEDLRKQKCVEAVTSPRVKKKKKAHQRMKDCKDGKDKEEKTKKVKENDVRKDEEEICETMEATAEKEKQPEVSKDLEQKMGKVTKAKTVLDEDKLTGNDSKETTSTSSPLEFSEPKTCAKNFPERGSNQPKNKKTFIYGNYNRYYGYRNPKTLDDPRLKLFQAEWFKDKKVLDIGCNTGNVTLQVGREFSPRHVLGIDIDSSLIRAAKKFLRCCIQDHQSRKTSLSVDFPMSFVVCRGPIIYSGCSLQDNNSFPYNVEFKEENFVPKSDSLLAKQKPLYDVILCLSLTKWIHLNWGDEGLKRTFKRMFLMLQPGGRLLLEAQPFSSYSRRKNLTEKIRRNYDSIQFKPNQFVDYLMSEEVGFASYEALGISDNISRGFQRPLYLFTKSVSGESYDALGVDISENLKKTSTTSHKHYD